MNENLPIVDRFLSYLTDERHFSPYTSRCYGLDLRQFVEHLTQSTGVECDRAAEQTAFDRTSTDAKTLTGMILQLDVERVRGFLTKLSDAALLPQVDGEARHRRFESDDAHSHTQASAPTSEGDQRR